MASEMHWNHRLLFESVESNGDDGPYETYWVGEVYYEGGRITGWTGHNDGPVPMGDSPAEVRQSLEWMTAALDRPVVDVSTGAAIDPEVVGDEGSADGHA